MSATSSLDSHDGTAAPIPRGGWNQRWSIIEAWMIGIADRMNPILVKETRQALKSRQFIVTFMVVLIACWIVSIAGVAMYGPQVYYAAVGGELLLAYYAVLVFPLMLIVPYSAFRSLAAEQEDNTYDLLSITTLTSKQIITGKLYSSCVQMAVYLCAVSPCIAFTFLLRGVDAQTTAVLLIIAVLGSLGLSIVSLLVGAMARVRHMQVVIAVGLVLVLAYMFYLAVLAASEIIRFNAHFLRDPDFWRGFMAVLAFYVTLFGLVHSAAAAQISFMSENRSTPLRRWMMAQQACFCGFLGAGINQYGANGLVEPLANGVMIAAGYWYLMGMFLTAEWPHLSRRVQRSLPKTLAGRTFFSFFNPGPAAGYMFALANLMALAAAALVMIGIWGDASAAGAAEIERAVCFIILSVAYVTAFLGIGRLAIVALRRWAYVPMSAGFLLHAILLLTGVGVPTVIQLTSRNLRNSGYSLIQMSNPFWTLGELLDHGPAAVQAPVLLVVIPAAAMLTLYFNLRLVAGELMHHRIAVPLRVAEDDLAARNAPTEKQASPWDDELDATVESQRS